MNIYKNFDKCMDLISSFNGVGLNIDEKLKLEIALRELHSEKKFEELFFWGKIIGEENDYFICYGINFEGRYGFPGKEFYFAPSNTFKFELLPNTYIYHDDDFKASYSKPLKGKPEEIIKKYKEEVPEGEEPEEEKPAEGDEEENKPTDPDASVDDNAPKKPEPKENFTEKLKLSYIVRQIDTDTSVVPKGAVKLTPEHQYRMNKTYKGLKQDELRNLANYIHFRPIIKEEKKLEVENSDAVFSYDVLDSIDTDDVKGSWSIQLDPSKKISNVRSLLWPGYFAVHQSDSNIFGSIYYGKGKKNAELPFMI